MGECVFCSIAKGAIPATRVYEDEWIIAFQDIHPAAPIHILIIPREHLGSILDVRSENAGLFSAVLNAVRTIASEKGIEESGFRLVTNCGEDAGQTVPHLHFHLLGGRPMAWPPG